MSDASFPSAWIMPSNSRLFDAESAFATLTELDWSEATNAHIRLGDRVLLYATAPQQFLTHECVVTQTGVRFDDVIDDEQFWVDSQSFRERSSRTWMRLRLVHAFTAEERNQLRLDLLINAGLAGPPQGRVRAKDGLLRYVEDIRALQDANSTGAFPTYEYSADEVGSFISAVAQGEFAVPDATTTRSTRGSAQRVFADLVKENYGYRCAVTGIQTRALLVASHIVPWSQDVSIRLDPSNGICLSSLVDRAFEVGLLRIDEGETIHIAFDEIASDAALTEYLGPFHGRRLDAARHTPPNPSHLRRRLDLVSPRQ